MKRIAQFIVLLLLACLTAGCASGLISKQPAPVYYRLDYPVPDVSPPHRFDQGLRIWTFAESKPYDHTEMVVLTGTRQVSASSGFQWITTPGHLLADRLAQDLGKSRLFPIVVGSDSPQSAPFELSGHVFTFAWRRQHDQSRAVLDVQVSLSGADHKVMFEKHYHFESKPAAGHSSADFAASMSGLVRKLSTQLQRDLGSLE